MPFANAARSLARRPLVAALALAAAFVPLAASATRAGDAPPAFSLPRLDGHGVVDLAKLRGKPVYLNFFASWCGPCNDEAAGVGTLYTRYHGKGLVTLGIDDAEVPSKGLAFAKQYRWAFATIADGSGEVTRTYSNGIGLPVHVFIDRRGTISTYRVGEMAPSEIDAAIKKIL